MKLYTVSAIKHQLVNATRTIRVSTGEIDEKMISKSCLKSFIGFAVHYIYVQVVILAHDVVKSVKKRCRNISVFVRFIAKIRCDSITLTYPIYCHFNLSHTFIELVVMI